MTHPFELDRFQIEAIAAIDAGSSVLVAAPTGSGKTVVAEYAIARSLAAGRKSFYTTPIKALSNQKFADLRAIHGVDQVGLLTGDNAVNPDAPIVVMTTEVLRNMIYAASPALARLDVVVLDEVHYLQDPYRGPVWEEVIIHAPADVRLVCLSATVSNAAEVAEWIADVRGPTVAVLETHRPVELVSHYAAHDKATRQLVVIPTLLDGKPNRMGERLDPDFSNGRPQRGKPRRRYSTPRRTEMVQHLAENDLLPMIDFIFSRAGCDDAVKQLLESGLRLTSEPEQVAIRTVVSERIANLSVADLEVLGYEPWLAGLERGIAAHHAGMVPAFKEAVEVCFARGLIRVVFATETLALGINMPARSVVIEALSKFTGDHHENLTPGEYTQLTGRAGRRGIDEVGHAVVPWSPFATFDQVAALAQSRQFMLTSSFRPTYNMTANLVRRYERVDAQRLLSMSFAQFQSDRSVVKLEARRASRERLLSEADSRKKADRLTAEIADLSARIDASGGALSLRFEAVLGVLETWNFVDDWSLTYKGELLVRTYHECDLLIAEAVSRGVFDRLDPAGIAAVASCLTYEHRSRTPPPPPWFPSSAVRNAFKAIEQIARDLRASERQAHLPETRLPDPAFVPFAHAWASGGGLDDLLGEEDLSGGDFVRNIRQLIDLLRQIGEMAPGADTRHAANSATEALFRGVIAASAVVADPGMDPAEGRVS